MQGIDRTMIPMLESGEWQPEEGLATSRAELVEGLALLAPGGGMVAGMLGRGQLVVVELPSNPVSLGELAASSDPVVQDLCDTLAGAGVERLFTMCPEKYANRSGLAAVNPLGQRDGGAVRHYGRQHIDRQDKDTVLQALSGDMLTGGPWVARFEEQMAERCGAAHGVAVSSGTAALHAAMHILDIGPGDEVIVPSLTFSADANVVVYQGGSPVFADVEPDTLCIDPDSVRGLVNERTRAIVAMDYAGQPCCYDALQALAGEHGIPLVADGCHSIGGEYKGRPVGSLADVSVFSFHPVKHITTGEGGMLVTDNGEWAEAAHRFRNHGMTRDFRDRRERSSHAYDIERLGCNYRMPDPNAALGVSQLARLEGFLAARQRLAALYRELLQDVEGIEPLAVREEVSHAWHLFVVRVAGAGGGGSVREARDRLHAALLGQGIGVNVHYPPVHLLSWYRDTLGTGPGLCPVAEGAARSILTLPLHPGMDEDDVHHVVRTIQRILTQ